MITKSILSIGRVDNPTKFERYYLMHTIFICGVEFTHIEYHRTQKQVRCACYDYFMTYEEKYCVKTKFYDYIKRRINND